MNREQIPEGYEKFDATKVNVGDEVYQYNSRSGTQKYTFRVEKICAPYMIVNTNPGLDIYKMDGVNYHRPHLKLILKSSEPQPPEGLINFDIEKAQTDEYEIVCVNLKTGEREVREFNCIRDTYLYLRGDTHFIFNFDGTRSPKNGDLHIKLYLRPKPQPQIPADPPKGWQVLTDEAIEHPERFKFMSRGGEKVKFKGREEYLFYKQYTTTFLFPRKVLRCHTKNGVWNTEITSPHEYDVFCKPKRRKWKGWAVVHLNGYIRFHKDIDRLSNAGETIPVTVKERRVKE